ncbi:MAG: DMT family transporter [Pseudomonadota bacterium]
MAGAGMARSSGAFALARAWAVLLGSGVAWGATQLFTKLAVATGHPPLGLVLWQTAIGAVLLGLVLLIGRQRLPLGRSALIFYAVCAVLGTALPHTLSYTAIAHLPVGVVSILIATVPMMTLTMSWALGLDRAGPRRVLGLALGAGAVALVVAPEASLPEPGQALWSLIYLIVALSYAAENVFIARHQPAGAGAVAVLFGLNLSALAMLLPLVAATGAWIDLSSFGPPEQALVAAALLHVVAYLGLIWLIGDAGPIFAAQIGYVVTLSGVGFGMAVLGEAHAPWIWLALGLVLAGITLVRPQEKPEACTPQNTAAGP